MRLVNINMPGGVVLSIAVVAPGHPVKKNRVSERKDI
jgi:hypothetical protein